MNDVMIILLIVLVALIVVRGPKMLPKIGEAMQKTIARSMTLTILPPPCAEGNRPYRTLSSSRR